MMAKAHKLSGTFMASPVLFLEPLPFWVRLLTVPIATYGALVPDWDHQSSTISKGRILHVREKKLRLLPRFFSKVHHPAKFGEWLFYKLFIRFPFWFVGWHLRVLSRIAQSATYAEKDKRGKNAHRMLTHTGLGCVAFGLVFWALLSKAPGPIGAWAPWFGFSMFLGCLAHILGDMLTPGGVPIWWPKKILGKRWYMVSARLFKTDSMIERLMVVPILYVLIGLVLFGGFWLFWRTGLTDLAHHLPTG